jgi:glutaminyl-tRNA synthetase
LASSLFELLADYLKRLRDALPFADGASLTKKFNEAIEKLLGPKTEADEKMKLDKCKNPRFFEFLAKKKKDDKPAEKKEEDKGEDDEEDGFKKEKLSKLVGILNWNLLRSLARDLATALNTPELLKKHLEFTGGKVITRFPPEPNGYIHIGHAKSIRFNFTLAGEYGGLTYLRYDDTNPEKETEEFINGIKNNLKWLGYEPWKITYASDNFEQIYNFAVQLIKKDKAYIDEQTPDEVHEYRKNCKPSPYRNRPIEESLKMFDGMRRGLYEEGKVCLRLKIDPAHVNPTMRDPVAYRIRYTPHPHAGNKWCIYPLYDFTHCICDSLENITHSCCTLEFEIRRDLYYWILEQLEIYRPYVWEFSRLNISNSVISKRKLHYLVTKGHVNGWDDPRLLTLDGLRRRGY